MKIDKGRIINDFIEPNKKQYSIPVYQRNYEWPREQCERLFEDIIHAHLSDKDHFCGSIVYALMKEEHNINYYVIVDGQQRLTTIYLLIKALLDSAKSNKDKDTFTELLFNHDKYDEYAIDVSSKLKLKPIKSDNAQLYLLMENKYDAIDKTSGIWNNYQVFKELILEALEKNEQLSLSSIYKGIEKLTCACIKLEDGDNAQEIFERINSSGVPLSLADKIRNFVLMTDANQESLYENYWIKIEKLVSRSQMSDFFLSYLNLKRDGFSKESEAYDDFKVLYKELKFTNETVLSELTHYATLFNIFQNGSKDYSENTNNYLVGLKQLKQTTCYLFLYKVFDDHLSTPAIIDEDTLEKVLQLLLNYSIRRIMCDVNSNSLRGFYKTLYNRVFIRPENKQYYYDSIVSFLKQTTSKDSIPTDDDFKWAIVHNNLFGKHALCRYLLISIENQGKEKIQTDNLTIEHVMPQNSELSDAWKTMLGENWASDRDSWLHTIGNLTLTGYNSELGDKPFDEKKKLIDDCETKVVRLYKDIQSCAVWNAVNIKNRAENLSKEIFKLFPIIPAVQEISFKDPRYIEYTCEEPSNATYKHVSYYLFLGERVNVSSFADMVRSLAKKLYDLDSSVIEKMARTNDKFSDWTIPVFSYDSNLLRNAIKLQGTDIYITSGYSASDCVSFIKGLLRKYDLDITQDFIYCAKSALDPSEESKQET